jgi:hypothetical protein
LEPQSALLRVRDDDETVRDCCEVEDAELEVEMATELNACDRDMVSAAIVDKDCKTQQPQLGRKNPTPGGEIGLPSFPARPLVRKNATMRDSVRECDLGLLSLPVQIRLALWAPNPPRPPVSPPAWGKTPGLRWLHHAGF